METRPSGVRRTRPETWFSRLRLGLRGREHALGVLMAIHAVGTDETGTPRQDGVDPDQPDDGQGTGRRLSRGHEHTEHNRDDAGNCHPACATYCTETLQRPDELEAAGDDGKPRDEVDESDVGETWIEERRPADQDAGQPP